MSPFDSAKSFREIHDARRAKYADEQAQGAHDAQCEWSDRWMHCNCAMRRRIASGFTEPPVLVFQSPRCDKCWEEVEHTGDDWLCRTCCVTWRLESYDEPGTFTDDHGPFRAVDGLPEGTE